MPDRPGIRREPPLHEMSIAESILDAARAELERRPGASLRGLGLRIGELAGVDSDSLNFCIECLIRETALEGLTVHIEHCPRRHQCPQCAHTFAVAGFDFECPACGNPATRPVGGDELQLAYLELDEP